MKPREVTMSHITANALIETWINGNRKTVVETLMDDRMTRAEAMHLLLLIVADPRMNPSTHNEVGPLIRLMESYD